LEQVFQRDLPGAAAFCEKVMTLFARKVTLRHNFSGKNV
jgi:hypothetical protein